MNVIYCSTLNYKTNTCYPLSLTKSHVSFFVVDLNMYTCLCTIYFMFTNNIVLYICRNKWKPIKWEWTGNIYTEFATARESATIISLGTQRQAGEWESFLMEKMEGFRYALIGDGWHGEAVGRQAN